MPWTIRYSLIPTASYSSMAWATSPVQYTDMDSAATDAANFLAMVATHNLPLAVQIISAPTPEPSE